MTLAAEEFHPSVPAPRPAQGFHRIRHYGCSPGSTRKAHRRARELLGVVQPVAPMLGSNRTTSDRHARVAAVRYGRRRNLRAAMPAPRSAGPCSYIRDAGVVTRHGREQHTPQRRVLAETVCHPRRPPPERWPRRLFQAVPAGEPSCSPDFGRSTFRGASHMPCCCATPAGGNRKPHSAPLEAAGSGFQDFSVRLPASETFQESGKAAFRRPTW